MYWCSVVSFVMDVSRITAQRALFDPNGLSQGESDREREMPQGKRAAIGAGVTPLACHTDLNPELEWKRLIYERHVTLRER